MIYASEKTLSDMFDISRATAYRKVKKMQQHPRYGKYVIRDGRFVRVQVKAFERYLRNVE